MKCIYLDNAATTNVTEEVLAAMIPYFTKEYGNPSSHHNMGENAKQALEEARKQIASSINAKHEQIIFTSGATESNNMVLNMFGRYTICHSYEHPSVLANCIEQCNTDTIPIHGVYNLIAQMLVNNETGEIYNIPKISENYTLFDATQAFGHIPIDVVTLGCDYLSLSGHKFHAPKGVGILYVKEPNTFRNKEILPLLYGGGQEYGIRSGTENVAGIVGLAMAAKLYNYSESENKRQYDMKKYMIEFISSQIPDSFFVLDDSVPQVPNILSVGFKGVLADDIMELLNVEGIYVGAGSACHNNNVGKESETLKYLGISDDDINSVIRISMSVETKMEDIKHTMNVLSSKVQQLRVLKQ